MIVICHLEKFVTKSLMSELSSTSLNYPIAVSLSANAKPYTSAHSGQLVGTISCIASAMPRLDCYSFGHPTNLSDFYRLSSLAHTIMQAYSLGNPPYYLYHSGSPTRNRLINLSMVTQQPTVLTYHY